MKLLEGLRHFFLPHESNNMRAKILHPSSLISIKALLVLVQVGIYIWTLTPGGSVLGYAANIPPSEVIRLTNEKRVAAGLSPLVENGTLSAAALAKGAHMLQYGYWAHIAPDGTQPWTFFTNAGYSYRYAGENLARDFSNPSSAVEAWMASPTHRDNMLSSNYKEIGIGVVEGNLAGADTTIIVQFFGTSYADVVTAPIAQVTPATPAPIATVAPTAQPTTATFTPVPTVEPTPEAVATLETVTISPAPAQVLVSPFTTTRGVSIIVVGILFVVMVIDAVLVSRRRIRRIGGRTFAHISFLGMILTIAIILRAGQIL